MTPERRERERYVARATILRLTLAFGTILALYFSLMALTIWEGQGTYAAFLPCVILVLGWLGSSLIKIGYIGKLVEPLSRSFLVVGLAGSFLALLLEGQGLDTTRLAGTIVCTILALLSSLFSFYSGRRRLRLASRAAAVALAGIAGLLAAGLSNLGPVQSLGPVALVSGIVTALISLLPLLADSRSRPLRLMATAAEYYSNVAGIGLIVFLVTSYLFVIRPLVGAQFPQALSIVEWSMVVIGFATIGWMAYRYLKSASGRVEFDDWQVLGDRVVREKKELGPASSAVSEFVEDGRKEGLILLVASVLSKNSVSMDESKRIVARIIDYREEEPRLTPVRSEKEWKARHAAGRRALVREVLGMCEAAVGNEAANGAGIRSSTMHGEGGSKVGDQ